MDTTPPPVQPNKHTLAFPYILLIVFTLVLLSLTAYLALQVNKLEQQINIPKTTTYTNDLSPQEIISKIKNGGTIDKIKTVNTDNWASTSGTATENKTVSYSYQYPNALYSIPNIRPGFDALYFFKNKQEYENYVACIQDKTPLKGGGGATRDWEAGCDGEGSLLFFITVEINSGNLDTLYNKPSDLTAYSGWGQTIRWVIPQKDKMLSGQRLNYYADGDTGKEWVTVIMVPTSENAIKSITGLDSYTLFTHLVASFRVKN